MLCLNVKPDGTFSIHCAIRDWWGQIALYCFILHDTFLYKAMPILNMGIRHDNKTNKCTWKYANLLHHNHCKPATCFSHLCGHLQEGVYTKDILQGQPNWCTNIKYFGNCVGALVISVLAFSVFVMLVLCVLFCLCTIVLICFVCTSVRITATKWQLNCKQQQRQRQ